MAANCIALEIKTFSVHEAVLFLEQLTTIVKATHISWAHILAEQCRRRTTGTVRAERKHQDYDFIWFDILYIYIFHSGNNCFFFVTIITIQSQRESCILVETRQILCRKTE